MTPTHRCAVRMTKQCRVSSVCVAGIQCQVSLLFSTHLWTALQPAKVFVLVLFNSRHHSCLRRNYLLAMVVLVVITGQ